MKVLSANVGRVVEVISRDESNNMGILSYKIINKLMKNDGGDKLFNYLNDTLDIFNQVLIP